MAITERTEIQEMATALPSGIVKVCYADIVLRDGREIAREIRRESWNPGDNVSQEEPGVQEYCAKAWTAEVVEAWGDRQATEALVEPMGLSRALEAIKGGAMPEDDAP